MSNPIPKFFQRLNGSLFNEPDEPLSETSKQHLDLYYIFDLLRVEDFISNRHGAEGPGRPKLDRASLVRAFIVKAYLNLSTTVALIDRLRSDKIVRNICGWIYRYEIPCEATFSNAFLEFSTSKQFNIAHDNLIKKHLSNTMVFHVSRDSTAIEAREKKASTSKPELPEKKSSPEAAPNLVS